jgi:hypothetical protein
MVKIDKAAVGGTGWRLIHAASGVVQAS